MAYWVTSLGDTVYLPFNNTGNVLEFLPLGSYLLVTSSNFMHFQRNNGDNDRPESVRKYLQNRTITAAAVDQPTFYYSVRFKPHIKETIQADDELAGGINVEAYRFLRDSLNFREKAVKSRGSMKANEKGELQNQGIAEMLNSDLADIAISLFDPLPYRIAGPYGVRFLHPVFKSSKAISVFVQPPKNSSRNIYGLPFHTKVWIGIIILCLMALLTFWQLLKTTEKNENCLLTKTKLNCSTEDKTKLKYFQRAHLWILSVLTKQGYVDNLTEAPYLRISIVTGFMASVIFHSVYSSGLTSIFAIDYHPISSFHQLIKKNYKMYYDKYVPATQVALENFKGLNVSVEALGSNITEIMERVSTEIFSSKSAILTSEDRFYSFFKDHYSDSFLCNKLSKLRILSIPVRNANFVKQGSPFRDIFNVQLLLMLQTGLIEKLYNEHDRSSSLTCLESFHSDFLSLDIFDVGFPYVLLCYAAIFSIVLLVLEYIRYYRLPKHQIFLM